MSLEVDQMEKCSNKTKKTSGRKKLLEKRTESRPIHKTLSGVPVRSKSEALIANVLTYLGISYKYEKPLYAKANPKDFIIPDFTIEHEGKELYWEHLWPLENKEYKKAWERKKQWYKNNGYLQKLIIYCEKDDYAIDSQEIERLAKGKILGIKS